jgi:hypothetical protein
VADIIETTNLLARDVGTSLLALDGDYLHLKRTGLDLTNMNEWCVDQITTAARRAVGQWPSAEDLVGRLVAALGEVAEQTTDQQAKSRLRQGAEALGGLTKSVVAEVAAKVLEHRMGLG